MSFSPLESCVRIRKTRILLYKVGFGTHYLNFLEKTSLLLQVRNVQQDLFEALSRRENISYTTSYTSIWNAALSSTSLCRRCGHERRNCKHTQLRREQFLLKLSLFELLYLQPMFFPILKAFQIEVFVTLLSSYANAVFSLLAASLNEALWF